MSVSEALEKCLVPRTSGPPVLQADQTAHNETFVNLHGCEQGGLCLTMRAPETVAEARIYPADSLTTDDSR